MTASDSRKASLGEVDARGGRSATADYFFAFFFLVAFFFAAFLVTFLAVTFLEAFFFAAFLVVFFLVAFFLLPPKMSSQLLEYFSLVPTRRIVMFPKVDASNESSPLLQ